MKKILIDYVIRNKKNFIIITILFCIGICIGTFSINNSNEFQRQELTEYITSLIEKVKKSENINNLDLLLLSIKENIGAILIIWFLGCTIIGGIFIYLAVIYKGFTIGYTISAMIAVLGIKQGIIISIILLFLQNIIFIPAFFIIAENRNKIIQRNLYKMHKFKRRSNKTYHNYVDYNYVIYISKFYRSLYFYEFINIFERNSLKRLYFFEVI